MIKIKLVIVLFSLFAFFTAQSQDKKPEYKVACIGFYNVENLYDTLDQENVQDEEFLPKGKKNYTSAVYHDKLNKLSDVISQLGKEAGEQSHAQALSRDAGSAGRLGGLCQAILAPLPGTPARRCAKAHPYLVDDLPEHQGHCRPPRCGWRAQAQG